MRKAVLLLACLSCRCESQELQSSGEQVHSSADGSSTALARLLLGLNAQVAFNNPAGNAILTASQQGRVQQAPQMAWGRKYLRDVLSGKGTEEFWRSEKGWIKWLDERGYGYCLSDRPSLTGNVGRFKYGDTSPDVRDWIDDPAACWAFTFEDSLKWLDDPIGESFVTLGTNDRKSYGPGGTEFDLRTYQIEPKELNSKLKYKPRGKQILGANSETFAEPFRSFFRAPAPPTLPPKEKE